jgi:hypothetical protein
MKNIFSLAFCLLLLLPTIAQNDKEIFFNIIEEDRSAINALVLYPQETRNAILQAAQKPEVLVKLENIQNQTRNEFIKLIESRSEDIQQNIYDIIRYPGLLSQLSDGRRKSEDEIRVILKEYPEEIHETAINIGRREHNLLARINELDKAAQTSFNNILSPYPANVQQAYRHLIELPEVIEILAQNMRMTVTVGDLYQREPQWVLKTLDSLQMDAAQESARETAEWKKRLEENPELLEEFRNSAESYARDKGFSEDEFMRHQNQMSVVQHHHYYSYPFWFGYPHWYPYSYWYRWPVWYDWGFYYGPGATIILTGMPSFYFTYWYLHHPRHHVYYPRLTNTFVSHLQNHPRSTTGVSAGVGTWVSDNRNIIPGNLLTDDGQRVERIRQFGEFETEYRERMERRRPERRVSREEFLRSNERRFDKLARQGIDPETLEAARPGRDIQPDGERRVTPDRQDGQIDRRTPESQRRIEERDRMERTPPAQREAPIQRQAPVERQRPQERTMPRRSTPPAPRQSAPPRQAPAPRQSSPPAQSPQRSPQEGNLRSGNSLQIVTPTDKQRIDMARTYHLNNWRPR